MNSLKQILSLAILGLIGFNLTATAQEIIFCEAYTNMGVPKKAAQVWAVDSLPLRVQIMYNNGKTTITNSKVNFLIEPEKRLGQDAEKIFVNVSQGRNWVVLEKVFDKPGKYAVSVFTPGNEIMAGSMITVKLNGSAKPKQVAKGEKAVEVNRIEQKEKTERPKKIEEPRTVIAKAEPKNEESKLIKTGFNPAKKMEITAEDKEVLHYDGVKLQFGSGLSNGKLEGVSESFSRNKGRVKLMTQVMNPQPLKTGKIQADFWLKSNTGEYDELVVSEEHEANPRSYKAFFSTLLFKSGEYKVSIYTEDFVWIASSYLKVE